MVLSVNLGQRVGIMRIDSRSICMGCTYDYICVYMY